ncbi:DUF1573 domain-containing protein [uncultured Proteiniphilum sp.]|uniref:DUF1573 domain-containing protein n=1 Tax=uncultured Proteiniphilum sp. TaxID=497637 RepID=UPI0026395AA1|nr:DUF1573 domain-containing protein [uncultured Proteiniphilum sp.]
MKNRIIGKFLIFFMISCFIICCKDKPGLSFREKTKKEETVIPDKIQPQIAFSKTSHSFGKIHKTKSDTIVVDFVFTNIGENPLIIKKVDVSCSCLSANYSKYPIKKDSIGFIRVAVNPTLLNGSFNKSVFVTSNSMNEVDLLKVKGTVY